MMNRFYDTILHCRATVLSSKAAVLDVQEWKYQLDGNTGPKTPSLSRCWKTRVSEDNMECSKRSWLHSTPLNKQHAASVPVTLKAVSHCQEEDQSLFSKIGRRLPLGMQTTLVFRQHTRQEESTSRDHERQVEDAALGVARGNKHIFGSDQE